MATSLTGKRIDILDSAANHNQGKLKQAMRYPSPFFDLSKHYQPRSMKELFKWCRYYYKRDGLITSVVYKLSEYPITDLIFEPNNFEDNGREKLKKLLTKHIKVKDLLIKIGLDYFTYGNCIVTIYFPFKRFFKCPKCETMNQKQDFRKIFGEEENKDKVGELDFKDHEFRGECPHCRAITDFKIKDDAIKQTKKININRYNPEHFDIEYNEITGKTTYKYNIPKKIKQKVRKKDEDTLMTLPKLYFDAIKKKKPVVMKNSNIFHFKRADVSDDDMGWGMPLILPVLRDMFHLQVLRKAQQQIAMEHLIPLRVLYPADNQSNASPHRRTGLGNWKKNVEGEIRKWKRDPNYIPIMPVPLGNQTISGDGKMLLLTQEMKMHKEGIISGMGVPQEFIFGGLSWSGSSISLRMLENHFLVYRNTLMDFLNNFLVSKIANFLGVKPIKVKMQEFKMADDVQRKQLLQQLNQMNKVSDKTLLKEVGGLEYSEEIDQIIKEMKDKMELFDLEGMEEGKKQGKVQEMVAKAQAKAQKEAAKEHERGENESGPGNLRAAWEMIQQFLEQEEMLEEQQEIENMQQQVMMQVDPEQMAAQYAEEIMQMPEDEQQAMLGQMREENPELFELVIHKLQQIQEAAAEGSHHDHPEGEGGHGGGPVDMRPQPEQRPPRRDTRSV